MILLPAIDILDGRVVRLAQGRFEDPTFYADDPLDAAHAWVAAGARRLHIVDLDGARAGEPVNLVHLEAIAESCGVPVQYGGGLRTEQAVASALAAGAARVVIGTAAYEETLLAALLAAHGEQIAVAVDVREGKVSARGWTHDTGAEGPELAGSLVERGAATVVYTDVDRDGLLEGPDVEQLRRMAAAVEPGRLVYSGGIGELGHLRTLADLGLANLEGVIVGKALYERRFTIAEGQIALGP